MISPEDAAQMIDAMSNGETVVVSGTTVRVIWGDVELEVPSADSAVVSADARFTAPIASAALFDIGVLVTRQVTSVGYRVSSALKDVASSLVTVYLEAGEP